MSGGEFGCQFHVVCTVLIYLYYFTVSFITLLIYLYITFYGLRLTLLLYCHADSFKYLVGLWNYHNNYRVGEAGGVILYISYIHHHTTTLHYTTTQQSRVVTMPAGMSE